MSGRIVNLDDFGDDCRDDAIVTLQVLVSMQQEPHRLWRITPSAGGAWNYEKHYEPVDRMTGPIGWIITS